MTSYYLWIIIFAISIYLVVTDNSISTALVYIIDIVKNKISGQIWWIKNNPRTPWAKYVMWRRSNQLAKELMDELQSKNK